MQKLILTSSTVFLFVFLVATLFLVGVFALRDARMSEKFDVVRWERTTVANKWLYELGSVFRDDLDDDESILRYFTLDDRDTTYALGLENTVEAVIEERITTVLMDIDVDSRLPIPIGVFPPVDFEIADSPRVLVVSPRDRIARISSSLLRPDLEFEDFIRIEKEAESDLSKSALVVGTGGVATYPAVVAKGASYRRTLEIAAHEWVHHYLFFYPLGQNYFASSDLLTINETVADLVGDELAGITLHRWGDPTGMSGLYAAKPASKSIEIDMMMRDLRAEVEALLMVGQVETAESRMEEVRLELCDRNFCPRRINQAYFAWFGAYAARTDATDPLGPQIASLREASDSLTDFLQMVRVVTSRAEIEFLVLGKRVLQDE
tara:strand:- start:3784 stop:4917 length:1134 start_codon:yes stop_codon:yes gene_type:complete